MSDALRLLKFYRPHLGRLLAAGISLLIVGVLSVLLVSLTVSLMGALGGGGLQPQQAAGLAGAGGPAPMSGIKGDLLAHLKQWIPRMPALGHGPAAFVGVGLWLLVFVLFKGGFEYTSSYILQRVGLDVVLDLRDQLYDRVLRQPVRFFWLNSTGALMSRITGDVGRIQKIASGDMAEIVRAGSILLGQLVFVFYLYTDLSFMLLIVLPLVVWPIVRLGRKLKRTSRKSQERMAELSSVLNETLGGVRVVKAFGAEKFERGRFHTALERAQQPAIKAVKLDSLTTPVIDLAGAVALVSFLVGVGWKASSGDLDLRLLPGFLAGLTYLFLAAKRLARLNNSMQQGMAAARRVFQILDLPTERADDPALKELPPLRGLVEFRNVHFAYGRREALRGIDLKVQPGEIVALVGRSGAGKTTLVSLLPRFYEPTSGEVLLDGHDIRGVQLASLRRQIGIVAQETVLFDDTVRRNIAYADQGVPLHRIEEAARAACADEFIRALPEGYETRIGERGGGLSAGQRQRLSIARAILRNAPILILDEVTSALDAESEALLQEALRNLMRGRTVFVIAHRLSTVRRANRILVLDSGRLVESGTHAELMSKGRLYRRLYELQFRDEGPARGMERMAQ